MDATSTKGFGDLLRRHRRAVGLTQEELAERAGVSVDTISNLERGVPHVPRKDTLELLADALKLPPPERDAFLAAARAQSNAASDAALAKVSPRYRVPLAPTPLVGRERELAAALGTLRREDVRLLTLTGLGGVGKTRLALEVARELEGEFADGACFVSLAPLRDPALVAGAIAAALGLREDTLAPLAEQLQAYLRDRQLLLLLDNFEHLLDASPLVSDLLATCRGLKALATSRAALHLRGEHEAPVSPLALPDPAETTVEALAGIPSVALFVQRAWAVSSGFALSAANAGAVAAICRQLDGLPLAIELAAARSKLLSPEALLERLDARLPLLAGGARDLPERQRTLRATLEWSYDLLSPEEQCVFRRLAVFAGDCALEAAEAVCAASDRDGVQHTASAGSILDFLLRLVDHHLLWRKDMSAEEDDDAPSVRIGMLETVREYAHERLRASGETEAAQSAHAMYYLALAEQAEPHLRGPQQTEWLTHLEREHDNLRAALRWAEGYHETTFGLRMAGALWQFWAARGHLSEGRAWLEAMIALADTHADSQSVSAAAEATQFASWYATALNGAGVLASRQSDYARATTLHERALALRRELGDTRSVASSLNNLGGIALEQADYGRAQILWEESLALRRAVREPRAIALALMNLGVLAIRRGSGVHAAALYEESVALFRAVGDVGMLATALYNLGSTLYELGEFDRAQACNEESLALARAAGNKLDMALAMCNLGLVARQQGLYDEAEALWRESLKLLEELGVRWHIAGQLGLLGALACDRGELDRAEGLQMRSLEAYRELGYTRGITDALCELGRVARERGDVAVAAGRYREALATYQGMESRAGATPALEGLAVTLAQVGQAEVAVRLCAATATARKAGGEPRPPVEQATYERTLSLGHAALGEERFTAVWAVGEAISLDDAIALALDQALTTSANEILAISSSARHRENKQMNS